MVKKIAGIFGIICGLILIASWIGFLVTGNGIDFQAEPFKSYLHMAAEMFAGVLLIVSGIGVLLNKAFANKLYLVALGATLYACLTGAGVFGQKGLMGAVVIFAVAFIIGSYLVHYFMTYDKKVSHKTEN